ncbi:antibiotic biosynthesis monooxygenase [Chitinophaga filiformis]|uniref:putative quinol monooxygenase n=1 Tax=Chitinophaga filiformis TaxID=104663 RepID=UPI001F367744|nr:antibiotic biosynthesis monooxygenase [Chitinophaga filiformis]MCF6405209.1 antibiotic biosynthesis monooxygenase [Chitinophaga filiformis]
MKIHCEWRLALSSFMYTWGGILLGRGSDRAVVIVLTKYHAKTAYQHEFLEGLSAYVFSSLEATGNIMSEAFYEKGDFCIMWVMERWGNYDFYKKNRRSSEAGVVRHLAKTGLITAVETVFLKDLLLFSLARSRNPLKENDRQITVMLFIEVKSGAKNYFRSIKQAIISVFRDKPGMLHFQLSRVRCFRRRFIVCKKFRDWDAFQYHLKDPALQPVITFLQSAVKEPPYEKGYHHLIQFAPLYGSF